MTFLPIVDRELRVAARRPSTFWGRFFTGAIVLLVWMVIVLSARRAARPAELSQALFAAMDVIGFGFALLAGTFFTADALSAEKREGTLGLLFLTDLRGYDVVLGKLAASSLTGTYAIMTIVPVMGLSLLMGGVTMGEFVRQSAVLVVTLYLSLAVGLFISSLSRETQSAMIASFLTMLGLNGILPLACVFMDVVRSAPYERNILLWLSPVGSFTWAFDWAYARPPTPFHFAMSLTTQVLLGTALIGMACWLLQNRWQAREEAPRPVASAPPGTAAPAAPIPLGAPRRCTGDNPHEWLATRKSRASQVILWSMLGLVGIWTFLYSLNFASSRMQPFGIITTIFGSYAIHFVLKCLLAMESTRRLSADKASGALEILMATPLQESEMLAGHWAGLRRTILPLLVLVLIINVLVLGLLLSEPPRGMGRNERPIFTAIYTVGILLLFLDAWAMGWVGIEQALRRKRHHWATLATMAKVMGVPWLAVFLFVFVSIADSIRSEKTMFLLIYCWLAGSTLISLAIGYTHRARVLRSFRKLATGDTGN